MRWPRFRLRLPRPSFDWLGGVINRTVVLYGLFTAVLFVIFLIVNFPHDIVVRRVVDQLDLRPLQLDFASAHFAWHKGYELRGIRLSRSGDDTPPLVECTTLDVRPVLADLVRGRLTNWQWEGALYGGTAAGSWTVANAGGTGQIELDKLELGRFRVLTAQLDEGQVTGKVSGTLSLQLNPRDPRNAQVSGEITIMRPALSAAKIKGFTVPDLQFSQVKGKLSFKGDRLELQDVRLTGDQLNGQLSGQIVLKQPAGASTLNLRATLEPSAATPDALKTLIAMLPRPANAKPDAPFTVTGTFAAPQVR